MAASVKSKRGAGYISSLSPDEIRRVTADSNKKSAQGRARYVYAESLALHSEYEFISCPCGDDCWCTRNGCTGHYRIKEITFHEFLETYVTLWMPPTAREKVKGAVLHRAPFNGRQRKAVEPLQGFQKNWSRILETTRGYDKCGLCYAAVPFITAVNNLYQGKMLSQLFYDSLVPFDTKSRAKIKRDGYTDPTKDFLAMNRELFCDLRRLSEAYGLGVPGIRQLDAPGVDIPGLPTPPNGQPLSRVVDKIFYHP